MYIQLHSVLENSDPDIKIKIDNFRYKHTINDTDCMKSYVPQLHSAFDKL